MSDNDKANIAQHITEGIKKFSQWAKSDPTRVRTFIEVEIPEFIRDKAEMISAHFLLPAGGRLVDMGCETGEVTYVLAQLNPSLEVIGVDQDAEKIEFARKTYRLPNLIYRQSDISVPDMEDESVDGIVNSNVLHGVYSHAGFNTDEVGHLLEKQVRKLKPGGTMLIRDYMMPPLDELVLLEVPNLHSRGKNPEQLSDADLLVMFSHTARPLLAGGAEGFVIEELPTRRVGTRLFRLPHKWAVEFVLRKNYRKDWKEGIREEFTFFTWQDYSRECSKIGMRMVYSSPYWNPWIVKNHFKGSFQLYAEDYKALPYPATNYFIVTQKVADKQSLLLEERRPSQTPTGDLQVMVVRDKKSGKVHELVKRPGEYCDIVPYRITADNRLVVYVRSGYPRPIINAGSRGRHNLDGKRWSGHLIEPIAMATVSMTDDIESNRKMIFDYVRGYAGLRPKSESSWYIGDTYFPAPDQIDEAIEAVYIEVENPFKSSWPIQADKDSTFTELGKITELDSADIIQASHVGLLPEPRMELHVMGLMMRNNIAPPRWIGEVMPKISRQHAIKPADPATVLKEVERTAFVETKNEAAVHLKPVRAVFIEEGKVGRQTRGLSAQEIEYIVTDDGIENIAIVLPITRDWDNNLLVALEPTIMPVPNRLGGDGAMLNAPSFPLPRDVRSIDDAKAFVASKFGVKVEQVAQMGTSFFTHVGVMPQRVYPFTVDSAQSADTSRVLRYMLLDALVTLIWTRETQYCMSGVNLRMISKTHLQMQQISHGDERGDHLKKYQGYSLSTDKVAVNTINAGYSSVPSRILGQRGPAGGAPVEQVVPEVQKQIENLMMPTIGKRLSQSYAQTKVQVQQTPGLMKVDQSIGAIGKSLSQSPANKEKSGTFSQSAAPVVAPGLKKMPSGVR